MSRLPSQIPICDLDNPDAYGRSDYTSLPTMHYDLVKQMEYGPQGLYWTGNMVDIKDYSQPNPQLVPPRLKQDPVPVLNPRFLNRNNVPPVPTGLKFISATTSSITVSWNLIPEDVDDYVINAVSQYANFIIKNILSTDIPYTITNLAGGNTYLIYVASNNINNGISAYSSPITAIPI